MQCGGIMNRKLKWCFKIKDGIKVLEPNKIISDSYIKLAKDTLKRAEVMLNEKDVLWTTVMIYYAEYYALYSFLARVGVKCENHLCSILLTKHLLGKTKTELIEEDKERRIDAQYYLKVVEENKIKNMLNSAKFFVADFEDIISNLDDKKINFFRNKIKKLIR